MKRAKRRPNFSAPREPEIVICDLRKERKERIEGDTSGEPVWWRTRWVVQGHRARRRYAIRDANGNAVGPVNGPDAQEGVTFYYDWVYIEQFEKGPDTAPLVVKPHVNVLNR